MKKINMDTNSLLRDFNITEHDEKIKSALRISKIVNPKIGMRGTIVVIRDNKNIISDLFKIIKLSNDKKTITVKTYFGGEVIYTLRNNGTYYQKSTQPNSKIYTSFLILNYIWENN